MLVSALMILFAIILGIIGTFLYRHQQRTFLLFNPIDNLPLQELLRIGGLALILMAIIAFVVAWTHVLILIGLILLLGCLSTTAILLGLAHFLP